VFITHQNNVAGFAGGHTYWWLPQQIIDGAVAATVASALTWTSTGKLFLFTASEWATAVVYRLEASFRSTDSNEVGVRLYNETAAAAVAGSEILKTSTSLARHRSGSLTLVDGNEYRMQVGVDSSAGAILGASVLALTPP